MSPLLHMQGISKSFAGVPALSSAELIIQSGEVHALVGQNGAGKSTIIKILNGAYSKDAGEISFQSTPVNFRSPHHAQLGGVSTIFQEVNLVGYRSVTENIILGQEPKRFGMVDWKEAHRMAEKAVERFGLDLDVRRPLHHHSIAIQQMIAIARAVSFDAKLVIMDEPTSSLDDRETEMLFSVIRDLKAEGVSILYVSHHLDELYTICDRVTIMRNGQTLSNHDMAEVSKLDLVSAMIGRDAAEIAKEGTTGFGAADGGESGGELLLEVEAIGNGSNLHDVSFVVHKGEIVGLAGLLGAGRSETAELIFGMDTPANGRLKIAGKEVKLSAPHEAIKRGIGFCTEDRKTHGIVPELSVRENMTLALLPKLAPMGVIPKDKEMELVNAFIEKLKIKTAGPEQAIRELSGGNQQKVLLARWLSVDPQLLILDEPTRGIDVGAKHEIQKLIDDLAMQGMSILMISSEFEELVEGASRVIVMEDGKSIATVERENLSEDALMQAVASHGSDGE